MTPNGRILVVTDLGPSAVAALQEGAARASAPGASLAVIHTMPSIEMVRPLFPQRVADDAVFVASLPQRVRTALDRHLAEAVPEAKPVEIFLETGGAADQALLVASRWQPTLIVIGAAAETTIDVEHIVRHVERAVLVVRDSPARGPVLACTDFSDPALPAIEAASEEAARTGDPLVVAHALEPIPVAVMGIEGTVAVASEWQEARVAAAKLRLVEVMTGHEGEAAVVTGGVVPPLLDLARRRGARMLVVGTVGRSGLSRFLLGSTAESLLRGAPCSVLVVRRHPG